MSIAGLLYNMLVSNISMSESEIEDITNTEFDKLLEHFD